ncbi:hypothetical protein FKW77_002116 [Venturia effusa]|uniref:Uncharacterized protein n=1 Tax=Venturia effusa TaxID=50376 RepID=A0A517LEY2_9PEZI|nr:hypothetical protein FKW77_002116 [Venturia effusa]
MKIALSIIMALAASIIAAPVEKRDESSTEVDSTVDAVNYILKVGATADSPTAYEDEINAVKNPADILGKRDEASTEVDSTVDAVNYILKVGATADSPTAYEDEINAVKNPADILG